MQAIHFKNSLAFQNSSFLQDDRPVKKINLIYVGLGFGLIYWILAAVRDVLSFENGTLLERLFSPGYMTLWMRLLVVCIIILFSVYAQSRKLKMRSKEKSKLNAYGLKLSLLFGLLYWIIEAFRDTFVFHEGNLLQRILFPDPTGVWMRLLPLFIMILFGIYSQILIDEQKEIEEKLVRKKRELQNIVKERTKALLDSNVKLKKEVKAKDQAQNELRRVNQALYTLSACNRSLVNVRDESALIQTICDLLVDKGGYAMAWVGYYQNNHDPQLEFLYQSGVKTRFPRIQTSGNEKEKNPLDEVRKTGAPICIHYEANGSKESWYQFGLKQQFKSSFFLPLKVNETIIGVLALYSADHLLNDEKENDLIFEMAGDLAFGITTIRMQSTHEEMMQTLEDSELKYGTITENLKVGVFRCSPDNYGHFLEANPALMQILGYHDKDEFLQTKIGDHFQFQTDVKNFQKKISEQGYVLYDEMLMRSKDGEPVWCSINVNAVHDSNGQIKYYDGVVENINKRKKLEKEKKEMQLQLIQAQKMEEVGVLAGGVAHDFNNILTAMLSISELNMQMLPENHELYKDMKDIFDLANRGAGIPRQLLIFSRRQHISFEMVDINQIIEGLRKMLNRLLGENITIQTNLQTELPACLGDKGTLEQVVMNLVVNARDAMPDGGQIHISTELLELSEDKAIVMPGGYGGSFIMLSVQDEGTGIEPGLLRRIFEPFFSTKGIGKGTGLGLSVVNDIVKQHKGWINIKSEQGKGTVFHIYIPVNTQEGQVVVEAEEARDNRGNGERILLIEDDEKVLAALSQGLEENGYIVETSNNAKQAMARFFEEHGNFHYIISDVVLPDENGLCLVEELISYNPTLKAILSSGYTENKSGRSMIEERGFKFLQKPFSAKQLTHALQELD